MDQGLAERVRRLDGALSPTERRLIEVLLLDPDAVLFESVAKVAARADAHASALVRLARKLGYDGFPELRMALHNGLVQRHRTDDLIRTSLGDGQSQSLLSRMIAREAAALAALPQFVTQEAIDAMARALLTADRIFVLAEGTAEALARHAAHRLRRAGLVTLQLHADPRAVAEGVTLMRAGDAVLGFCLREPPRLLRLLLQRATAAGMVTAVISDLSGLILRPTPQHLLAASRGPDSESGTLTVPMAILNTLILKVAEIGAPDTLSAYERYSSTRDEMT